MQSDCFHFGNSHIFLKFLVCEDVFFDSGMGVQWRNAFGHMVWEGKGRMSWFLLSFSGSSMSFR